MYCKPRHSPQKLPKALLKSLASLNYCFANGMNRFHFILFLQRVIYMVWYFIIMIDFLWTTCLIVTTWLIFSCVILFWTVDEVKETNCEARYELRNVTDSPFASRKIFFNKHNIPNLRCYWDFSNVFDVFPIDSINIHSSISSRIGLSSCSEEPFLVKLTSRSLSLVTSGVTWHMEWV